MRPLLCVARLREMLAANEIAMMGLNEKFDAMPAEVGSATNSSVSAAQQALAEQLQSLQSQSASFSGSLEGMRQSVDAQEAELSALRSVRRELSTLRSSMQTVEKTVADLYIIERSRRCPTFELTPGPARRCAVVVPAFSTFCGTPIQHVIE